MTPQWASRILTALDSDALMTGALSIPNPEKAHKEPADISQPENLTRCPGLEMNVLYCVRTGRDVAEDWPAVNSSAK